MSHRKVLSIDSQQQRGGLLIGYAPEGLDSTPRLAASSAICFLFSPTLFQFNIAFS